MYSSYAGHTYFLCSMEYSFSKILYGVMIFKDFVLCSMEYSSPATGIVCVCVCVVCVCVSCIRESASRGECAVCVGSERFRT